LGIGSADHPRGPVSEGGREPLVKDPIPLVRGIFEVAGFADHCEMTG
jgi:hypothetical protein